MDKLKKIISDSENLINSEFIPSPKKNRIMAYCANLRDLLQDLIGEFKTCSDVCTRYRNEICLLIYYCVCRFLDQYNEKNLR